MKPFDLSDPETVEEIKMKQTKISTPPDFNETLFAI